MERAARVRGLCAWVAIVGATAAAAACATSGNDDSAGADANALAEGGDDAKDDRAVDTGLGFPESGGDEAAFDAGQDAQGSDAPSTTDASTDRQVHESGADAESDGGSDAKTHDGGQDATAHEGGTDASHEGGQGHDGAVDSGHDASIESGADSGLPPPPAQGEVLITEVMYDPSTTEPNTEWFELYNTASGDRLLSGLVLRDGAARTHTIASSPSVVIPSGAYVVLARLAADCEAAKVPASAILYEYGTGLASTQGILLANGSTGGIALLDSTAAKVLAQSPYGPWSLASGGDKSIQLKDLTFASESTKASWCASSHAWTSGSDDGTPGAASDCP